VTGLNVDNRSASVRAWITGGGAPAVAERIELTLSVKYTSVGTRCISGIQP